MSTFNTVFCEVTEELERRGAILYIERAPSESSLVLQTAHGEVLVPGSYHPCPKYQGSFSGENSFEALLRRAIDAYKLDTPETPLARYLFDSLLTAIEELAKLDGRDVEWARLELKNFRLKHLLDHAEPSKRSAYRWIAALGAVVLGGWAAPHLFAEVLYFAGPGRLSAVDQYEWVEARSVSTVPNLDCPVLARLAERAERLVVREHALSAMSACRDFDQQGSDTAH